MTGVLMERDTNGCRYRKKAMLQLSQRLEWMQTPCQALLITTKNQEEARKDSFPEPSEGEYYCKYLDFKLVASGTVREKMPVV